MHNVNAMADPFRVCHFNRQSNVAAKALGRHESGRQLAGVQIDMRVGIYAMQVIDEFHLQYVVGHRGGVVLGLHISDADKARVGRVDLKAEEGLREDLFFREIAQDLVDVADRDLTCGRFLGRSAMLERAPGSLGRILLGAVITAWLFWLSVSCSNRASRRW